MSRRGNKGRGKRGRDRKAQPVNSRKKRDQQAAAQQQLATTQRQRIERTGIFVMLAVGLMAFFGLSPEAWAHVEPKALTKLAATCWHWMWEYRVAIAKVLEAIWEAKK